MITQEDLDRNYFDCPAAAKTLGVTTNHVRYLCAKGKLKNVIKLGTSGWIIPKQSVFDYKPEKRGPKSPKIFLKNAINEADNLKNFHS